MAWKFDTTRLATLVHQKRHGEKLGMRDVTAQCGVSPSTISRVERGDAPDMSNFLLLVGWLEIRPESFFQSSLETEQAAFTSKAQKFRQLMALLVELDITPERVAALETIIIGLLPPILTGAGVEALVSDFEPEPEPVVEESLAAKKNRIRRLSVSPKVAVARRGTSTSSSNSSTTLLSSCELARERGN